MVSSNHKKATQALNYFARKKDGKINKLKAIKLIYLADRYHIRKYGRPIIGDNYLAMNYGPVGSMTLDIANHNKVSISKDVLKYVAEFITGDIKNNKPKNILSKKEVDLSIFSQSDLESLEKVYEEFRGYDEFELADISHKYPEWKKCEPYLKQGKRRTPMNYEDFFLNPKQSCSDVFFLPKGHLSISKQVFLESEEVSSLLS